MYGLAFGVLGLAAGFSFDTPLETVFGVPPIWLAPAFARAAAVVLVSVMGLAVSFCLEPLEEPETGFKQAAGLVVGGQQFVNGLASCQVFRCFHEYVPAKSSSFEGFAPCRKIPLPLNPMPPFMRDLFCRKRQLRCLGCIGFMFSV